MSIVMILVKYGTMLVSRNQKKTECWVISDTRKQTWFSFQVSLVFIAWLYLCWLHWDNNGLWFFDSPGHAANGLFWKDYLLSFSLDPRGYTLSYHARYPVINPTKHPPVFYLLEAIAFGGIKSSPYIAKGLVLGFALIAGLYTMAWSRRWISEDAGWAGMLLVLLPGVIQWSHAIMLNIPALALSIGALYHFRRWLESPPASILWRHLYIGAALAMLSIFTYVTSCVLLFIAGIWFIVEHRWRLLWNRRILVVVLIAVLALLPWVIVVLMFEKNRFSVTVGSIAYLTKVTQWQWTYYIEHIPELFNIHLLFIAAFGVIGGLIIRKWRHETILLLIMTVVCFIFFSYVPFREARYILLLSLPLTCFCLLGLLSIVHWIVKLTGKSVSLSRVAVLAAVTVLIISQASLAYKLPVNSVSGYKQLVDFIGKVAPDEPIFYDGKDSAVFTFYIQAGDPDYRRRVVLGSKLLYADSWRLGPQEFVSSAEDVVEVLQERGGCKWVVVADHPSYPKIKAPWYLREAVKGPQFELVRAFPVTRTKASSVEMFNVCVYRLLVPVEQVDEVDMPFLGRGENVHYRSKPIQR